MEQLKPGMKFAVGNKQMIEPLVNQIVRLKVNGQEVTARIISVSDFNTEVQVVTPDTKE